MEIQNYILPKVWKSSLLYGGRTQIFWNSPFYGCLRLHVHTICTQILVPICNVNVHCIVYLNIYVVIIFVITIKKHAEKGVCI